MGCRLRSRIKDHRDDFAPQYLRWIDVGYRMSALDFFQDQEIRSEIYDAIQGVLNRYDLLITPTLACLPVDNAGDGNTMGPTTINREEVDPLIGWCLFHQLLGPPRRVDSAGLSDDNLPVGMQIIGRRYADADVLAASGPRISSRPAAQTASKGRMDGSSQDALPDASKEPLRRGRRPWMDHGRLWF